MRAAHLEREDVCGLVVEEVRELIAGKDGLGHEARESEHRKAAVGELLHLKIRHLGRIGAEAKGIEA
eukprot:scaffold115689_cov32-Tisochrysis_lutea.AAC.2